jgi:acyl phosphate:glycerol-3-phosphate acyltransferase
MAGILFVAALCYLLGSIPFGYLLVRIFRGEDVRLSGSGNIGATNVSRKSPVLGIITLFLDALKGALAVVLAYRLSGGSGGHPKPYLVMAIAAFCAVLGHVFPVWLRFRGGKGVATALGAFFVIAPLAVLVATVVFVVVVAVFRYVSLGSIAAVASFPLLLFKGAANFNAQSAWAWTTATSLLIIARHHENIRRLLAGTENRLGAKRA